MIFSSIIYHILLFSEFSRQQAHFLSIIIESIIILLFIAYVFYSYMIIVQEKNEIIIERFGSFNKKGTPGINLLIPFIDKIAANYNLRTFQENIEIETKTKDNVFVHLTCGIQHYISDTKKYYYELYDADVQMESLVCNVVRSKVPQITLDDLFLEKEEIAVAVKEELANNLENCGIKIIATLVVDIKPNDSVKIAMNKINESERLKIATENNADAEKIKVIKNAEAQAESKRLQGVGTAGQRLAIIQGLKDSLHNLKEELGEEEAKEAMLLLMTTQYFDTLKDMSHNSKSNTIFTNNSPSEVNKITQEFKSALLNASAMEKTLNEDNK